MDETDELKQMFFDEAAEQLDDLEAQLAGLVASPGDLEPLHGAFRAAHSIKGAATLVGLDRIVDFAHRFESLLHRLRSQQLATDEAVVALLLRGRDMLHDLIRATGGGAELADGIEDEISARFAAYLEQAGDVVPAPGALAPAAASRRLLRLQFVPAPEYLSRGGEPRLLFAELRRMGRLAVSGDPSAVPPLDAFDPVRMHLRWTMELETAATAGEVRAVFESMARPEEFEIIDCGSAAATEAPPAIETPSPEPPASPAEAVAESDVPAEPTPAPASPGKQKPAAGFETIADAAPPLVSSIRVDIDRMDRLVNLVGELVISQSMLTEQLQKLPAAQATELTRSIEELSRHARSLQEGVMAIRAQPVQSVFSRMSKLVRELAAQTGKRLRLETSGEDTEIDKTVIEQLHDPITHMIRNAADHGIEPPEERLAGGKPAEGVIRLCAGHANGRIVIRVSDDGRGIDRERLRTRAVEAGQIAADQALTEEQTDNLIFLPGLSTAAKVSNISGRGVGMDVVRRNIQRLGGRVTIRSVPGQGSTFYLTLPLTLAVLDGMLIRVGAETFVVPLNNIIESLRPKAQDVHMLVGGEDVLSARGEYVPLVYLNEMFGISGAIGDAVAGLVMLVDTDAGGKVGLVVDEIIGQQQVVSKSLEANYTAIPGIAGATILGSGRVALILDVSALHRRAADPEAMTHAIAAAVTQDLGEQL